MFDPSKPCSPEWLLLRRVRDARPLEIFGRDNFSDLDQSHRGVWAGLLIAAALMAAFCMTAACLGATPEIEGSVRSAVVKLSTTCSGVCFDPSGLVMTAKHCDAPETADVLFADRRVSARLVYVSSEAEGPVVYRCDESGPFPYRPVAAGKAESGEPVFGAGFEGSSAGNLVVLRGSVVGGRRGLPTMGADGRLMLDYPQVGFNIADFQAMRGMSGGPLFNETGEVVGLLTGGSAESTSWISWAACREAAEKTFSAVRIGVGVNVQAGSAGAQAGAAVSISTGKPELLVFTAPYCAPCAEWKRDYLSNSRGLKIALDRDWLVEIVDTSSPAGQVKAGQYRVQSVPAFVPANYPEKQVSGYRNPEWLLAQLAPYVQAAAARRGEKITPTPDPVGSAAAAGVDLSKIDPVLFERAGKTPEPPVDWSDVTIVCVASNKTPTLLRLLEGPAKRGLSEISDGKASLEVVAESRRPRAYAQTVQAAGIDPNPLYVLILVEKQDLGLKGFIVSKVEQKLQSVLSEKVYSKVPIEVVFQRQTSADFDKIKVAVESEEPESAPGEVVASQPADTEKTPWYYGFVGLLRGVGGFFGRKKNQKESHA